jgi:hypothetical protein
LKTYRPPRNVVVEIKRLIATDKPLSRPPSVLVRILRLLCESRSYARADVFLVVNGREVAGASSSPQVAADRPGPELSLPIKIASYRLGSLCVQLGSGREFGLEERVLLHEVSSMLAVYFTGKGKYLVRKAREALRDTAAAANETQGYKPASDKGPIETRRAAAGDKSRT